MQGGSDVSLHDGFNSIPHGVGANYARSVSVSYLRYLPKTSYRFVAPPLKIEPASLGFDFVWGRGTREE